MSRFREYLRHRLIGTSLDPIARGVRRQITIWKSREFAAFSFIASASRV